MVLADGIANCAACECPTKSVVGSNFCLGSLLSAEHSTFNVGQTVWELEGKTSGKPVESGQPKSGLTGPKLRGPCDISKCPNFDLKFRLQSGFDLGIRLVDVN